MKETIIYNSKFLEKPDVTKIQEYIDYCDERASKAYKQLHEFRKDKEIVKLENEIENIRNHSLQVLTDKEKERIKEFRNRHYNKCNNGGTYWFQLTGTGIGTAITIKCDMCGEEEDITDTESW